MKNIFEEFDSIVASEQKISSANTSRKMIPALFNKSKGIKFDEGTINLDYGGGRFDEATKHLASLGVKNLVFDPYNRSPEHNDAVIKEVQDNGGADTITCNNVLNVIQEEDIRIDIIKRIKELLKPGGKAYFTVYEGNGSGEGKETRDGYQLNRKTREYLDEFNKANCFSNVSISKGVIIAQ